MRDPWGWAVVAITITLFGSGAISFGYWLLQTRRRPEVEITWWFSWDGVDGPYDVWLHDRILDLPTERSLFLRIGLVNVGDAPAGAAETNVVVPECLYLERSRSHHQ